MNYPTMEGGTVCRLCSLLTAVVFISSASVAFAQNEEVSTRRVTIPPLIMDNPDKKLAFREEESIELTCVAEGIPDPTYKWQFNGKDFEPSGNDGRIAIQPGVGTLIFARPIERDEGIYQCFAENTVGTALSVKVDLRLGILEPFASRPVRKHYPMLGDSLTLGCTPPRSYPAPEIFWATVKEFERFTPIYLTDRVSIDPEGNLHFSNIIASDYQDGRQYVCIVQNSVMRRTQHGDYHQVFPQGEVERRMPPAIMWQSPTHQVAKRGETLRIKCIFSGSPTPRVTWERKDLPMPSRSREDSFGQELVIEDVQEADEGKYECVGINDDINVQIRRSFDLKVESAPFWVDEPISVDATEGQSVAIINCKAEGFPEPVNFWAINGVPISPEPAIIIDAPAAELKAAEGQTINITCAVFGSPKPLIVWRKEVPADPRRFSESNRITFYNVTKDDALVVQCNATNRHGYVFSNAYLNVLTEPAIIIDAPAAELKAAEGQTINITCAVFGSPKPLIVWRKGDDQLTGGRFTVNPDGHLTISDLSLVDAGQYTCMASNVIEGVLHTDEKTGSLIVRRRTQIERAPLDVMVIEGTEAKFTCTASTDPEEVSNLVIEWKKDGELIDYALAQRMFKNNMDNSLTISGTISLDTGKYTCVAQNGLDSHEMSAQLVVQGIPDPPSNVKVECKDQERKAEITWQPGKENYAPILNFIVQMNTTFSPDTWINIETNVSQNVRKLDIALSPWGNYTFRVLARNKIGLSPPSLHTRNVCRTEEDIPDRNPENVMGEGDLPNNLVIYWTPMPQIEQNGRDFKYIISYRRDDIEDEVRTATIEWPEYYHYVAPLTTPTYKPYRITVKSRNAKGDAREPVQEVIGWSGEDVPTVSPQNLAVDTESVGATYAMLMWEQVDTTDLEVIRGKFRGYRIQFYKTEDGEESMREKDHILNATEQYPRPRTKRQAQGEVIMFELDNLPPYSEITVQVRVLNKYYAGPPSQSIYFTTVAGEPGPPVAFDVIARGATHFELMWEPPAEPNGILDGYNIAYQRIMGLNLGRLQYREPIDDPETSRARLTGLQPDQDYRIYLYASTQGGRRGEPIFLDAQTTPAGTPSPPTFDITEIGYTYAIVQWEPSRSGNPGSVFYVQHRPRGSFMWLDSPDEVLNYYTNVTELINGTTYQLRVVSKNGEGYEAPSEWQEFITSGVQLSEMVISKEWWFYGIFIAILILVVLLILFLVFKKQRDRWWEQKEAEIEDQVRHLQAEEAAHQLGVVNQYAMTGSQEMLDASHASLHSREFKEPIDDDDEDEESDEESEEEDDEYEKKEYPPDYNGAASYGGYAPQQQPQHGYQQPAQSGYHPSGQQAGYHPGQQSAGYHPGQQQGGYHPAQQPSVGYHPGFQQPPGYHPGQGYHPAAAPAYRLDDQSGQGQSFI